MRAWLRSTPSPVRKNPRCPAILAPVRVTIRLVVSTNVQELVDEPQAARQIGWLSGCMDVPLSRSKQSSRCMTSWWAMMSVRATGWALGPSGCHVLMTRFFSYEKETHTARTRGGREEW